VKDVSLRKREVELDAAIHLICMHVCMQVCRHLFRVHAPVCTHTHTLCVFLYVYVYSVHTNWSCMCVYVWVHGDRD